MQKSLSRFNSPLISVLICLCIYGLFVILFMEKNGKDASYFIHAGDVFVNERMLTVPISVLPNSHGYDGQFYYRLALDPFTNKRISEGIMLDNPHYRQQRIMYPFLSSIVAFNKHYLPEIMIGINLVYIGIVAYFGSRIALHFQKHAAWGALFSLWPGFLFTISRNLTEIVASGFLLAGIYYFLKKKYLISALLFTFAVLSKETTLVVPLSIFASSIFYYVKDKKSIYFLYTLPLFIYGTWQLWLNQNWPQNWSIEVGNNIGLPFAGITEFIKQIPQIPRFLQITSVIELLYLIVFITGFLFSLRSSQKVLFAIVAFVIYLVLMISLTYTVWVEDIAFLRAINELCILGILIFISSKSNQYKFIFPITILFWIYMFVEILKYR